MINKSNIGVAAIVASLVLASPALAQSIPGYGSNGSVVELGHTSNVHQESGPAAESLRGLHDSAVAPNGGFDFQFDRSPWNGADMGNRGH
jgi:hypothetical protein